MIARTCSRAGLIAAASQGPGSCKRGLEELELSIQIRLFLSSPKPKDVE